MGKAANIGFDCRSFEWERIKVEEYKNTLHGHTMCQIGEYIYIYGGQY
jgi:hypothetical protein